MSTSSGPVVYGPRTAPEQDEQALVLRILWLHRAEADPRVLWDALESLRALRRSLGLGDASPSPDTCPG